MRNFNKEFYIPQNVDIVFVSDLFVEDYTGGAELTMEAIIKASPYRCFKLHSASLTPEIIEKNKNKIWILVNFSGADKEAIKALVYFGVKFYVIEADYKYCKWRSSHLHKLQENVECDCYKQPHGIFIRALYQRAKYVFFMSYEQMNVYKELWEKVSSENFVVQSSTFTEETLNILANLRKSRENQEIIDKYIILKGGSWIKAEEETKKWCEKNNINYELVGGISHGDFLKEMSKYKGLVFHPAGYDTCPRITIEAKLAGLDLKLNENVQHKNEPWFSGTIEECESYLKGRAKYFWKCVSK